ncbi:hypothetical protein [Sphaerothrix gracilis]|uniref:hypothetical protein n=1 Tax=Sphaerothrix gracilis TaxID=3151835 RepID=UPI0031FC4572
MSALTASQLFGSSATLTSSTLTISLADLAATGLDGASPSASQVAAALVKHWQTNTAGKQDDSEAGVYVGDAPFFALARNNTQIEQQYAVSFYRSAGNISTDPDEVV